MSNPLTGQTITTADKLFLWDPATLSHKEVRTLGLGGEPVISLPFNAALASSSDGTAIVASATTKTELGHLSGTTSNVQTQLDGKEDAFVVGPTLVKGVEFPSGAPSLALNSSCTAAELDRLSGVTSPLQEQLDGKQPVVTGAASSVTSANLTPWRVATTDGSGKLADSTITINNLNSLQGASVLAADVANRVADLETLIVAPVPDDAYRTLRTGNEGLLVQNSGGGSVALFLGHTGDGEEKKTLLYGDLYVQGQISNADLAGQLAALEFTAIAPLQKVLDIPSATIQLKVQSNAAFTGATSSSVSHSAPTLLCGKWRVQTQSSDGVLAFERFNDDGDMITDSWMSVAQLGWNNSTNTPSALLPATNVSGSLTAADLRATNVQAASSSGILMRGNTGATSFLVLGSDGAEGSVLFYKDVVLNTGADLSLVSGDLMVGGTNVMTAIDSKPAKPWVEVSLSSIGGVLSSSGQASVSVDSSTTGVKILMFAAHPKGNDYVAQVSSGSHIVRMDDTRTSTSLTVRTYDPSNTLENRWVCITIAA